MTNRNRRSTKKTLMMKIGKRRGFGLDALVLTDASPGVSVAVPRTHHQQEVGTCPRRKVRRFGIIQLPRAHALRNPRHWQRQQRCPLLHLLQKRRSSGVTAVVAVREVPAVVVEAVVLLRFARSRPSRIRAILRRTTRRMLRQAQRRERGDGERVVFHHEPPWPWSSRRPDLISVVNRSSVDTLPADRRAYPPNNNSRCLRPRSRCERPSYSRHFSAICRYSAMKAAYDHRASTRVVARGAAWVVLVTAGGVILVRPPMHRIRRPVLFLIPMEPVQVTHIRIPTHRPLPRRPFPHLSCRHSAHRPVTHSRCHLQAVGKARQTAAAVVPAASTHDGRRRPVSATISIVQRVAHRTTAPKARPRSIRRRAKRCRPRLVAVRACAPQLEAVAAEVARRYRSNPLLARLRR